MTVCDRGQSIIKNSVTYFMDGPQHIFRMITYTIKVHPVIALMFSQTGTDVLPRRDEDLDEFSAAIEPHRIMVQTWTQTRAGGLKVRSRTTTTAAHVSWICSD